MMISPVVVSGWCGVVFQTLHSTLGILLHFFSFRNLDSSAQLGHGVVDDDLLPFDDFGTFVADDNLPVFGSAKVALDFLLGRFFRRSAFASEQLL